MKLVKCVIGFGGPALFLVLVLHVGVVQAASDPCRAAVGNANEAAQQYRAAARDVAQTCTKEGGNCTGSESQADTALQSLVNAHETMLNTCPTGSTPPPPPAPPPTIAGDLVITELMRHPFCEGQNGEWFEVYNPTSGPFDLLELDIVDGSTGLSFRVLNHVIVPAGGFVVFLNANQLNCMNINGPVVLYTGLELNDAGTDGIIIRNGSNVIDRLEYTPVGWPLLQGRSDNLDPDFFSASGNDPAENWCFSTLNTSALVDPNETGSPWQPNEQCP